MMGAENKSTKHVKHPEQRTHSTIHVLTHQPTPPTNPPTQQPTDAPTYPPTMWYSNTAEYSSSSRYVYDTNRVAVALGSPCINHYPPSRGLSRPFPERPPLAESSIGARSFAGKSYGGCVGRAWSHREAAQGQVELGSRSCFLGTILRHPGERADPSPGGRLSTIPAPPVGHGTRSLAGRS